MVKSVSCCCVHGSWLYSNPVTISNDNCLATWRRRLGNVRLVDNCSECSVDSFGIYQNLVLVLVILLVYQKFHFWILVLV